MPATKTPPRVTKATRRPPAPKRPDGPFPGYITDEWFNYAVAMMKRRTPAEVRRDLVKFGIIDKQGNYTAPYRND